MSDGTVSDGTVSDGARAPIVWFAGVRWDDIPGTDRRLAAIVGQHVPVLWVDSPARGAWRGWLRRRPPAVEAVAEGIIRVRVPALPGFSRWPVRLLTAALQRRTVRRNLPRHCAPRAIIVAHPVTSFPRDLEGARVLLLTDDWIAGAELMGYERDWLTSVLSRNAASADAVAAITPPLIEDARALGLAGGAKTLVLPNGAPIVERMPGRRRQPIAGVVGQLNERLDIDILRAVADAGITVRLVGPRADQDPDFTRRLDRLLEHERIDWVGPVDQGSLAAHLAEIGVGLTPYADSAFNRASFPLKTLEYLAAGAPAVSTDIPASRWLNSEHVDVTADAASFVAAVAERLRVREAGQEAPDVEDDRVAFAASHSWARRADDLLALIDDLPARRVRA